MQPKTLSESLFERFCLDNGIEFSRVPEGAHPTPDYCLIISGVEVYVEVKELSEDLAFSESSSTRTVGDHIRAKITDARKQVKAVASGGHPAILLIYNDIDPYQLFGTEEHDFLAAMYGELTVSINLETNAIVDSFHGRNRSLREGKNDGFSAIGRLSSNSNGTPTVHLYQNIHARVPVAYESLPACITFNRVETSDGHA